MDIPWPYKNPATGVTGSFGVRKEEAVQREKVERPRCGGMLVIKLPPLAYIKILLNENTTLPRVRRCA